MWILEFPQTSKKSKKYSIPTKLMKAIRNRKKKHSDKKKIEILLIEEAYIINVTESFIKFN